MMSHRILGMILVIGLAVCLPVHPVVRAEGLALNVDITHISPGDELDHRYGSEYGLGLIVEYMYTDYFGMSAAGHYVNLTRDNRDDADFSIGYFTLNGQIAYPFLQKWRVFATGGMGFYIWKADNAWWIDGYSEESVDIGINMGAGVSYKIWEQIEIVSRLTQHRVKFEDQDQTSEWLEYSLGARFTF
jgi:Outer membrane protein beta-barrel domain